MSGFTFLLIFLMVMATISLATYYLRKLSVPGVVAAMLVGIAIGPSSILFPENFDLIDRLNQWIGSGYPTVRFYSILSALGQLGLIFLMALAGMEVSLRLVLAEKRAVTLFSICTFALPASAGYLVYCSFNPDDFIGKIVFASLFASHSIGIVFPTIRELKIAGMRFGVVILATTIIADISSLILFAICVQLKRRKLLEYDSAKVTHGISLFDHVDPEWFGNWFVVVFILIIILFIVISLWIVPKVGRRITRQLDATDDLRITFFLVVVLTVVLFGEMLGVSAIVGAFISGMAIVQVPGFHDHGRLIFKKMEGIGYGLIIPIMFFNIGMQTDLRILLSAKENIAIVLATVGGLVGSKILAGVIAITVAGFGARKGLVAGLMTVPQLSATLAAAEVAKQMEMITPQFFNAIIVLSIVTTIPTPSLVKWMIIHLKISFTEASADAGVLAKELTHTDTTPPRPPDADGDSYVETYI